MKHLVVDISAHGFGHLAQVATVLNALDDSNILLGRKQNTRLHESAGCNDKTRFVLVALGGIGMSYPLAMWPVIKNVCWIFSDGVLDASHVNERVNYEGFVSGSLHSQGSSYDRLYWEDAIVEKKGI